MKIHIKSKNNVHIVTYRTNSFGILPTKGGIVTVDGEVCAILDVKKSKLPNEITFVVSLERNTVTFPLT